MLTFAINSVLLGVSIIAIIYLVGVKLLLSDILLKNLDNELKMKFLEIFFRAWLSITFVMMTVSFLKVSKDLYFYLGVCIGICIILLKFVPYFRFELPKKDK